MANIICFFTKEATLMRRSTVLTRVQMEDSDKRLNLKRNGTYCKTVAIIVYTLREPVQDKILARLDHILGLLDYHYTCKNNICG